MSGRTNGHKSHISSREAKARGRSNIPPWSVRQETLNMIEEGGTSFMAENYASFTVSNSDCTDCNSITTTATTGTSAGDYYTWQGDWNDTIEGTQVIPNVVQIIKKSEVTKVADLRTLFRVYVVNPKKNGKILVNGEAVIAVNENQAMLKAGVAQVAAKENVDIEDLDVYVEEVGTFIRPRKKAEKVRIVKKDEED